MCSDRVKMKDQVQMVPEMWFDSDDVPAVAAESQETLRTQSPPTLDSTARCSCKLKRQQDIDLLCCRRGRHLERKTRFVRCG